MTTDDKISRILKETPLAVRLEVSNQMMFLQLLKDFGCPISQDEPASENQEKLNQLFKLSKEHMEYQLQQIKKWEEDGRPE